MQKISPCLWFDREAEEAANFYVSLFDNSRIVSIARYGEVGPGGAGSVMTVAFELDGRAFTALNGGPHFKFTEAVSLQIDCADQSEVDRLWERLSEGGSKSQCGWLKDRWGLSWQVVPRRLMELVSDPDRARSQRAMAAVLKMTKIDIAALEAAAAATVE